MLSSAEVKQLKFEKAVFGGYDMQAVDTAFSQLSEDYEKLEQQNVELRSKMKVLISKIEEYRSVEDGIRQALVTAQNIAEETMEKANREAERILNDATAQAEQITRTADLKGSTLMSQYEESIAQEKAKLREAQHESAYFIEMMSRSFREESERIAAIAQRVGGFAPSSAEDGPGGAETISGTVEAPIEPQFDDSFVRTFSEPVVARPDQKETSFTVEVTGSTSES
ncbi:MAG: DivIVA domain-containing protein [Butyricicoccus sp.]